jgi:hypothetical protein
MEQWRAVPGYKGDYLISSEGVVWSVRWNRTVKIRVDRGYNAVALTLPDTNRQTNRRVATLVLKAFRPQQAMGRFRIKFLNGITTDDRLENLEVIPQRNYCKLTEMQVREIRHRWQNGNDPYRVIASDYGISKTTVCHIISGRAWQTVK